MEGTLILPPHGLTARAILQANSLNQQKGIAKCQRPFVGKIESLIGHVIDRIDGDDLGEILKCGILAVTIEEIPESSRPFELLQD